MKAALFKDQVLCAVLDSARKVVYLAIMDASKKWTMPIRNWRGALNRFIIEFEDRLAEYVQPVIYTEIFTVPFYLIGQPSLLNQFPMTSSVERQNKCIKFNISTKS